MARAPMVRSSLLLAGCLGLAAACTSPPEPADEAGGTDTETGTDEGADDWADSLEDDDEGTSETGSEVPLGPELIDYETCIVDPGAPTASIVGETPDGPFSGQYAYFGWLTCEGEPLSPTLVVTETPEALAAAVAELPRGAQGGALPLPSLEWVLLGNCNPENGWTGKGGGGINLRTEGGDSLGFASFSLIENYKLFDPVDPEDPPTMHGTIFFGDGWTLEGEFTAVYCGALSYEFEGC